MSYQVIARKWRPQSFEELVGQPHVSRSLLNALRHDRLPHALLFSGARGVGKTSSARILAKSLRCPSAIDFVPCNTCKTCEDIAHGSSLDVIEIDGASNNGVDAIRELRETVGYMPATGRYKVYIIDEVHMLSTSAFNALLKTLEEPPPHVIFIFATTEPQKIPITILSRCQRFDFRKIPTRQIVEKLQSICDADQVPSTPEALWLIARQAEGSMRDSQSLLDQAITFSNGELTFEKVVEILGLTDRSLLRDALIALIQRDAEKALGVIENVYTAGIDARVFIQDLLEELRHLLLVKTSRPEHLATLVDLPESEIEFLKQAASRLSTEDIHLLFDMTLKGANEIPRSQAPRVVFEMLLLRMVEAPRIVSLQTLFEGARLPEADATNTRIAPAPRVSTPAAPTPAAAPITPPASSSPVPTIPNFAAQISSSNQKKSETEPSVPLGSPSQNADSTAYLSARSPQENWLTLVTQIKTLQPLLGAKLEHTALMNYSAGQLVVGVKPSHKYLLNQLRESDPITRIKTYVQTFWGANVTIDVQVLNDESGALTPKSVAEKKLADTNLHIQNEVENHPLVKKARDIFKTEIKQIKERS